MGKKRLLVISLTISLFLILPSGSLYGATYYVATNGNDDYNGLSPTYQGGFTGPFKTITKGSKILGAGDFLFLRSGIYHETAYFANNGTDLAPITIASRTGEWAVIDGQDVLPANDWGVLFHINGTHTILRDLEVRNSKWMGVFISGAYSQAINVYSHHNFENGILLTGDCTLAQNCRVWWNCRSNEFGKRLRGGWASGLSAARHPRYAKIRKCIVWNNWGEGLSTYEAVHTTLEDNIVYDNQANIYISDAIHCLCQRNLVYSTVRNPCSKSASSQVGIAMGDEKYNPPSSNNIVINNFLLGNKRNFYWWQGLSGGGLVKALFAYNTLVNSVDKTNFQVNSGNHSDSQILNNIILQEDSLPIAIVITSAGLTFSHNLWSSKPPLMASGIGDVIGNPFLAKTGSLSPGALRAEYFKISADSPARGRAKVLTEVKEDFFRSPRGLTPDIGAHQYAGGETKRLYPPAKFSISRTR
jgi:hypothetical protein